MKVSVRAEISPEAFDLSEVEGILRDFPTQVSFEVQVRYSELVEEIFSTERNDTWKPLADRTVRERVSLGYSGSHPILIRSGSLRETLITPAVVADFSENRPGDARMILGVDDNRFRPLQRGCWGTALPARDMLPPTDVLRQEMTKICFDVISRLGR